MPDIATINGIAEDNIATYNGATASTVTAVLGNTWVHYVGMAASGGNTHVTVGDYKVATFTSYGNFVVSTLGHGEIEYLVIAGGAS